MAIPKKPRKCRVCKTDFQPHKIMQICCSVECAIKQAQAKRTKAERIAGIEDRKTVKAKRDAMKTLSQWLKEAQAACNAYVRERDKDKPCISCGRFHDGAYDAGHYRTVGAAPSLRFDLANIHKQCVPCNQHKSGNIVEYRIRLIERIGQSEVDRLEGPLDIVKYNIDDARCIKAHFKFALKELRK